MGLCYLLWRGWPWRAFPHPSRRRWSPSSFSSYPVLEMSLLANIIGFSFMGLAVRMGQLSIKGRNLYSSAHPYLLTVLHEHSPPSYGRPRRTSAFNGRVWRDRLLRTPMGNLLRRSYCKKAPRNPRTATACYREICRGCSISRLWAEVRDSCLWNHIPYVLN